MSFWRGGLGLASEQGRRSDMACGRSNEIFTTRCQFARMDTEEVIGHFLFVAVGGLLVFAVAAVWL